MCRERGFPARPGRFLCVSPVDGFALPRKSDKQARAGRELRLSHDFPATNYGIKINRTLCFAKKIR